MMKLMTEAKVDAFVFFDMNNIRYLSGFTGTDGVLIATEQSSFFLTDSRYEAQAQQQVNADRVICYQKKIDAVIMQLVAQGVKKVGFEASFLPVSTWQELTRLTAGRFEWIGVVEPLKTLRGVKAADEIRALEAAAQLHVDAFAAICPLLVPGTCEREIALQLEFALKRAGGEDKAFDFIVASGYRGALPHGVASDKKLASGELVTIDFGTRIDGYHSDETITVAIGSVSTELRAIFDIVLQAHDRAIDAVKPGVRLATLDAVARDFIAQRGYAEAFGHGLGHGVGLDIHEYPALSPRATAALEEGMVVTIEPGIYLPGVGGVRIEDTVVVTADGCRCLTRLPKHFQQFAA